MKMRRDFEQWLSKFKTSIYNYEYYVDFDKVIRNVEEIKVELNLLNSLLGSKHIENDFRKIINKYPETLSCIPILLAVRRSEIFILEEDTEYIFNFEEMNYDIEDYITFMHRSGLFDLLANRRVSNLVDYVFGVETGLDSNARKNRSGTLMENLVESFIQKAGFEKGVSYYKEMESNAIERNWGLDLSALTHQGATTKKFDFVVKTRDVVYAIETNFYAGPGSGSKLNETARSYQMIATNAKDIEGFKFIWITDGTAWFNARNNLRETFDTLQDVYSIDDLENGILDKVLV